MESTFAASGASSKSADATQELMLLFFLEQKQK
jgi:hypothetical protein